MRAIRYNNNGHPTYYNTVYYNEVSRGSIYTSSTSNYPVHAGLLRFSTLEMHVQHSSLQIYTTTCYCHALYSGRQTTPFGIIVDAPAGVTQEEGPAVLALIFIARKIRSSLSRSSSVKSNFVYPRHNNRSPLVGHDVRESSSSCDCAEIRTHVPATSEGFEVTN